MRSADLPSVIESFVTVVMTLSARLQRSSDGAELNTAMFAVTSNATDSGIQVRLDYCRHESISRVAGRALRFHASSQRVTGSARAGVRVIRNRR